MNENQLDVWIRRLSVVLMLALGVGLCGIAIALYGPRDHSKRWAGMRVRTPATEAFQTQESTR